MASSALWAGCDDKSEDGYDYFLRDAAAMEDMGLPVYWLGREFDGGGLTFQGPYGLAFGGEVEGGGMFMRYISWLGGTPGEGLNTGLEITEYSTDAWDLVKDRMMNPPVPGVTRETVTVGGRKGDLLFLPLDTTPLNILRLVLDLDGVVVVAQARAGGPTSPGGPDYSPFINNPDLFVQVMQDLRPYSE